MHVQTRVFYLFIFVSFVDTIYRYKTRAILAGFQLPRLGTMPLRITRNRLRIQCTLDPRRILSTEKHKPRLHVIRDGGK